MDIADTIFGCLLLGGLFVGFTAVNYGILFMELKKAERIPSPAPIIGGVAGAALVACLTGFKYPWLIAIPLIIDPGCVFFVFRLIYSLIKR